MNCLLMKGECLPMSLNVGREYLAGHRYRYMQGAEAAGHVADNNQ